MIPNKPEEPVHGWEFTFWEIRDVRCGITQCRYVYHVSSTWEETVPREEWTGDQRGADFEDEWQVFQNGEFCGRWDGWSGSIDQMMTRRGRVFLEYADAQREFLERCDKGLASLGRQAEEITTLRAEMAEEIGQ